MSLEVEPAQGDDLLLSFVAQDVGHPGGGPCPPAVVFVSGFPGPAFEERAGCKVLEMASYVSCARLVACPGLVAITCANRDPVADLAAVLRAPGSE